MNSAYRRGYFALAASAPGGDRRSALERAIGDPLDATAIPIVVSAVRGADASVELSIHAGPDGLTVTDDRHGMWKGGVDTAVAQVLGDGKTSVDLDTTVALTLSTEQHDAMVRDGLTINKVVITLRPDMARVVVVLRDASSGVLGSVAMPASALQQIRQRE